MEVQAIIMDIEGVLAFIIISFNIIIAMAFIASFMVIINTLVIIKKDINYSINYNNSFKLAMKEEVIINTIMVIIMDTLAMKAIKVAS